MRPRGYSHLTNAILNFSVQTKMHIDGLNADNSLIVSFGDFAPEKGGDLWIYTGKLKGREAPKNDAYIPSDKRHHLRVPESRSLQLFCGLEKGALAQGRLHSIKEQANPMQRCRAGGNGSYLFSSATEQACVCYKTRREKQWRAALGRQLHRSGCETTAGPSRE